MHGAAEPISARAVANRRLLARMQQLHQQTKARYGAVKLWRALLSRRDSVRASSGGATASPTRPPRPTGAAVPRDDRTPSVRPPAPNRLRQVFVAPAANRIWAGDLTAIATRAGWLYLAVLLDLYSRRIIGWAMSARARSAGGPPGPADGVDPSTPAVRIIHHTDQGALLYQPGLPADCWRRVV